MVLTKYTGIQTLTGSEAEIFNVNKGATTIHFGGSVYLDELVSGDTVRVRVYDKKDGVGFWKFDGEVNDYVGSNNGTITYHANLRCLLKFEQNTNDSTTTANNFTASGTSTYVSGQEGSGFSFDGSTNMSKASFSNLALTTASRSVSFWIYPTTFTNNAVIFEYGAAGTRTLFSVRFTGTAGKLALFDGTNTTSSTGSLTQNAWNYVTFVLSTSGTLLVIYFNGVQDSSTSITALNTSTSTVFVGSDISSANKLPSGTILDEVRYYDTNLSSTQAGALYMVGKYGQSHTFDGGEYISVGNPTALQFERTNSFTLAGWIKIINGDSSTYVLWSKRASSGANAGYAMELGSITTGCVSLNLVNTPPTSQLRVTAGSNPVNDGTWHHVVATYSGNSLPTGIHIYIDNVDTTLTTNTNTLTTSILTSSNFIIGSLADGSAAMNGQLDDFRIYNRVLSSSEVSDLYNNPQNLNSIVYDKQYSGPLTSKTLYIPIIQTNNYAVTLQQTAGNYYKTLDWSRIEIS